MEEYAGANRVPSGLESASPRLSVQDMYVSFTHGKQRSLLQVVDGVSFDVPAGQMLAVIGPSGSGKTTLLRAVSGLYRADSAVVLVDGNPVEDPAKTFSMVFQDARLLPWRTIRRNVEFALELQHHRRLSKEDRDLARYYLDAVGLLPFADYYPHQVSGGMKQRAGVARALTRSPKVLLMDEPFGALDAQTRMVMQDLYLELQEAHNLTSLLVTHDIEEAVYMSSRCIVLGPRPARVRAVIDIDGDKRRSSERRESTKLAMLRTQIWEMLRQDAVQAASS
jgi:NitT/TauT family transport system ATP-binding protein